MSCVQYFDELAAQWDTMRESFYSESVREAAFDAANLQPGMLAVDVGAGTGFITEGLLQRGLNVVAIDQSYAMLNELKKKFPQCEDLIKFSKCEGLKCRFGKAEKLPIPSNAVDYVFANMCLHHIEEPSVAVVEMSRILRSGGTLVITDIDKHEYEFLRQEQCDRWMGFNREDVSKWLNNSGLVNVSVESVNQHCCAEALDGHSSAIVSIFVASGRKM